MTENTKWSMTLHNVEIVWLGQEARGLIFSKFFL